MFRKMCGAGAALTVGLLWAGEAFASCTDSGVPCPGGGLLPQIAPEIDASAGVAALALVATLGALLYGKARKR